MHKKLMNAIVAAGGRPLLVGGAVRDKIIGKPNKDIDVEVFGLSIESLVNVLGQFGKVSIVGESFGVVKVRIGGEEFDFSLPRRDSKVGVGHKGFAVEVDHLMTYEQAAARRDFTINAIAETLEGERVDPYNGERDLVNGLLRATSEHFKDDPLRVLRGMQFAARFDMGTDTRTAEMSRSLMPEYKHLAVERVATEFLKLAEKGVKPSRGLDFLVNTGWIELFPQLNALRGVKQDEEWHPEGDVFVHTKHVADAAALIADREGLEGEDRVVLVLAAICHDFGKPATTVFERGRYRAPGHDDAGVEPTRTFLESIGMFPRIIERVLPLVKEHMVHVGSKPTERTVRRLTVRLGKATMRELLWLIEADHSGRPPLPKGLPKEAAEFAEIAKQLKLEEAKPQPIIMGRHLIDLGMEPGPEFGRLTKAAFEAQLDGVFHDLESGLEFVRSL